MEGILVAQFLPDDGIENISVCRMLGAGTLASVAQPSWGKISKPSDMERIRSSVYMHGRAPILSWKRSLSVYQYLYIYAQGTMEALIAANSRLVAFDETLK
jgi:hypothetical protein